MIAVDTSALAAIFLREPESALFMRELARRRPIHASCVSLMEFRIVAVGRLGAAGLIDANKLIATLGLVAVPFDAAQSELAVIAFTRYGKGIHSATRLNICDCAAYALAKTLNAPLLYKGDDFRHTGITSAI